MRKMEDSTFIRRNSSILRFLWVMGVLDLISWAVSIGAIVITRNKTAVYETELRAYYATGGAHSRCTNAPHTCPPYEPTPNMPFVLLMTLLPLIFDILFLPTALCLAIRDYLHPVFLLCGALFAFMIWSCCGIFDAISSLWSSWESQEKDAFDHVWGAVAGMQVLNGVIWLGVMIAACGAVRNNNKRKRIRRVENLAVSTIVPGEMEKVIPGATAVL